MSRSCVLKKIPIDPRGNEYAYSSDGHDFSIVCFGKDGQPGGTGLDEDIRSEDLG